MFGNTKLTKYFEQSQRHVHTKIQQTFRENKFIIEEANHKQTHIPVVISL